ncbi:hypothetical protein DPMN_088592 [Dreissena polymorpha]|uniref:Uncharacterized protein n=1 Tax=Dreissena polymorpha TaxID=45954 RepID=A0A9D4KUD0_DREPO|nr:hypothetical protein DPMN_088592 [Dreissena polymorpha]
METKREEDEKAAKNHLMPRSGCKCQADWQDVGTARETRLEPTRMENDDLRPMPLTEPQETMRW